MRLTSFTDYSVRVLMYVANKPQNELSSIREVSEYYKISKNHLMKVVHNLAKGGYLYTVRGKNGGFRLGKEARMITIGEIIRYTEDHLNFLDRLVERKDKYMDKEEFNFARILSHALASFLGVVDSYTIQDLLDGQTEYKSMENASE